MTFQVTGRPLTSSGKHSGPLLMGLRYGRGDAAPARCPHPLPTSSEDQSPADHVSGREKPDTFGRELQCGSPPGACCGFKGSEPHVGAQSQPGTRITPISQGLTRASWNALGGMSGMDHRAQVRTGREVDRGKVQVLPSSITCCHQGGRPYLVKEHGLGDSDWATFDCDLAACPRASVSTPTARESRLLPHGLALRVRGDKHGQHRAWNRAELHKPYFPASPCPWTRPPQPSGAWAVKQP